MVRSYTAKLSTEQENSLKVLDAMGRTLNRKINIVDSIDTEGGKANACFDPKTNEYTIALDSVGEAYLLVAAHENVHDIAANNREGYAKMESIVMDTLESLGLDEETLMDVQRALAPNENEAYWREEIVANTVPSILSDEATLKEFVQKMAGADADTRSAFVKFLDTMRDFLRNAFDKLKVELSWQQMQIISENQQAIERIRDAYFEALDGLKGNTRSENGSNEVYSIRYTTDNVPFVLADRDILDGVPKKDWVKTVKENLKKRFPDGVRVGKNTINIQKESRQEMTFSKYMQWAFRNDRVAYLDKLRATDNADEILRASRNYVNEALLHPRKDNISQFARGDVLLRIGENDYTAEVIIGTNENGNMLLYDVIRLSPTTIKERNKIRAQQTEQRKSEASRKAVPTDTVAQPTAKSNSNTEIKFSMQDSDGNTLTEEQQEYFKNSKVRDEDGRLMVMHHGTPYGGFTVFKSASYFTQDRSYADKYQNPSASSLRGRYNEATNPTTYDVYLNMEKPFDTRNSTEREIFDNEYYRKYGTGAPLAESGLPDWTDGMDLQDFIEEMEYDYDGLILDEGGVGGYGDGVTSRGLSYVVFDPSQVKNVSNKQPTSDPDIRFSMQDAVEETDKLLAIHNLTGSKLNGVLELGGFPMPSIAVLKATQGHDRYGDVSVVFDKATIDPKANSRKYLFLRSSNPPLHPPALSPAAPP